MEIIPSDKASATILTWFRLKNKTAELRSSVIHLWIQEEFVAENVTTKISTSSI